MCAQAEAFEKSATLPCSCNAHPKWIRALDILGRLSLRESQRSRAHLYQHGLPRSGTRSRSRRAIFSLWVDPCLRYRAAGSSLNTQTKYIRANSNMVRIHFSFLGHVSITCLRRHTRSFTPPLFRVCLSCRRSGRLESTDNNSRRRGCLDNWFYPARHLEYRHDSAFCCEQHWHSPPGLFRRRRP